jgi:hypothetical protein
MREAFAGHAELLRRPVIPRRDHDVSRRILPPVRRRDEEPALTLPDAGHPPVRQALQPVPLRDRAIIDHAVERRRPCPRHHERDVADFEELRG